MEFKNTMKLKKSLEDAIDHYGDDHVGSSSDNPIRPDAFELTNPEKIQLIEEKVADILHILGMDLTDDSLKGTPNSKLIVEVERQGAILKKEITRDKVIVNPVPFAEMIDEETGYITLTRFNDKASSEVKKAYRKLKKQGMKINTRHE